MNWKKWSFVLALLVLSALLFFYFQPEPKTLTETLRTEVKRGSFEISVIATGELKAKNSQSIKGPQMRTAGIWNTTITDIIAEGTVVTQGDYVATLDRTELSNKLKELGSQIEKAQTQLTQAKLDTAIEMRGLRDGLVNLKFSIREKQLELEQSKYEPPATQQRIQLDADRLERDFRQKQTNYELQQQQAEARIKEILTELSITQNKYETAAALADAFIVKAPEDGMVIYRRSWNGQRQGPGAQISAWDPVVAELPDLSSMISKTYVNEVDISKIQLNDSVEIQVDAFPEKQFKGIVRNIANIGEQLPNFDAKVFEVKIQVLGQDSLLRPAMSTRNEIVTETYSDKTYIPLEALASNDSMKYVFVEEGSKVFRQEVLLGKANANHIIIEAGLEAGTVLHLTHPQDPHTLPLRRVDATTRAQYEQERANLHAKAKADAQKESNEKSDRMFAPPASN